MAAFQIVKGKAVSYQDGNGADRLAFTGDEDKLKLSAEQEAALRKAKVLVDAPVEAEAREAEAPSRSARKSASAPAASSEA